MLELIAASVCVYVCIECNFHLSVARLSILENREQTKEIEKGERGSEQMEKGEEEEEKSKMQSFEEENTTKTIFKLKRCIYFM